MYPIQDLPEIERVILRQTMKANRDLQYHGAWNEFLLLICQERRRRKKAAKRVSDAATLATRESHDAGGDGN